MAKRSGYTPTSKAAVPNASRSGYKPAPMMRKGQQQKGAVKARTT